MSTRPKVERAIPRRPTVIETLRKDQVPAAPEPAAESKPAAPESEAARLSIPLTADGRIAWDRMRPATQESVKKLLGHDGPKKIDSATSRALVGALVASLSTLSVGVARMTGHTPETSEGLRLTATEQNELIPLWQAALDDYAVTLGRHENLIIAAATTGIMLLPRVQALERVKKIKPNGSAGGPLLALAEQEPRDEVAR